MVTFRVETPDDLPALVALRNRANPWEPPEALERARHRERTRDPSLPFLGLIAEGDASIVGMGSAGPVWWFPRHIIALRISVEPEEIWTNNNTTNAPMIAVNERLGYRRQPGRIRFGRTP